MKIYKRIEEFNEVQNPIVTIGTFDGVHVGHQKIIAGINKIAASVGGESVLLTFSPHPRSVVSPDYKMELISTMEEKISLLEKAGLDHLIIYPFTSVFSEISPEDYVKKLLWDSIGAHTVVVGYDHKFGKNRQGDFTLLQKYAAEEKFNVEKIPEETISNSAVSSTIIRKAIRSGELVKVRKYLGRAYTFSGTVVDGQKRGKELGFPTANLQVDESKLLPDSGVFAVQIMHNEKSYEGMLNIGYNPTLNDNGQTKTVEVNIFFFSKNIYGQELTVSIIEKIREEQKFDSLEALKEQLTKDRSMALFALYK